MSSLPSLTFQRPPGPLPRLAGAKLVAVILCVLGLSGSGCGADPDRAVLRIGEVPITARQIDSSLENLQISFSAFGTDTLRWRLLNDGLGQAAILHHRLAEESERVRGEAEAVVRDIKNVEEFLRVARVRLGMGITEDPSDLPSPPSPAMLGSGVAAAVAKLEGGEWAGPIATALGWEVVLLLERYDEIRSRGNVKIVRLVFEVGTLEQRKAALEEWRSAKIEGELEYMRAVPEEFRES